MAEYPVTMTDDEWRKMLTPEQYQILRQKGTERSFTSSSTICRGRALTSLCCPPVKWNARAMASAANACPVSSVCCTHLDSTT